MQDKQLKLKRLENPNEETTEGRRANERTAT